MWQTFPENLSIDNIESAKLIWQYLLYRFSVKDIRTFRSFLLDFVATSLICRKKYASFFVNLYVLVDRIVF